MARILSTVIVLLVTRTATSALCPQRCVCDDVALRVECIGGDLGIVPITLNPRLRHLTLRHIGIGPAIDTNLGLYSELQELDLSRNSLTVLETGALQHQTNLVRLDFSHNKISVVENRTFHGLHNLKYLMLAENLLESLEAGPFSQLSSLKELDVSSNRIKSLHPKALRGLRSLEYLNLQNNLLTSAPAHALRHAESLEYLVLSGNKFSELYSETFKGIHGLRHVELDGCELRQISDDAFKGSSELETLSLQDNSITEIPTVSLIPLRHLKTLSLAGNPISEVPPSSFTPLASLRALDLSRCSQLTKLWRDALNGLAQLAHLNFSYDTGLQVLETGAFVGAEDIASLDLAYSGVQALSLDAAADWSTVVDLNLTGCPLQCNCVNLWLRSWLLRRNETVAECYFPERLRGRSFAAVEDAAFDCDSDPVTRVLVGLGCGLAIVALGCLCVVMHRYGGRVHSVFKSGLGKSGPESGAKEKDCGDASRRLENEYIIYAVPGGIRAVPITEL